MTKERQPSPSPKRPEHLGKIDLAKKIAEDTQPLSQSLHELLATIKKIKKDAQNE